MSYRGSMPQAARLAQISAPAQLSQDIQVTEGEVKIVDLKEAVEQLQSHASGLPIINREYMFEKHMTLASCIAEEKNSEVMVDASVLMRSKVLRPNYKELCATISDQDKILRKSVVSSLLPIHIDAVQLINFGPISIGVRCDGIRGRVYGSTGEKDRFLDVIPPVTNAPFVAGQRRLHQPTLEGTEITAASFANVTEEKLRKEFQPYPGSDGMGMLMATPSSKILASLGQLTNKFDPVLCEGYGFEPGSVRFHEGNPEKGMPPLLFLPMKFFNDAVLHILEAQQRLSHFNPLINGDKFKVKFMPVGCNSWSDFTKSDVYRLWKQNGEEYLKSKLNEPFYVGFKCEFAFLPDDAVTQNAVAVQLRAPTALNHE